MSSLLPTKMSPTVEVMAETQNTSLFLIRDTTAKQLVRAYSKKLGFLPVIKFSIGDKPVSLLHVPSTRGDARDQIVNYVSEPTSFSFHGH